MKIINKRAMFDYSVLDTFEAGVVLSGAEVKAFRAKNIDLNGSYARILQGEMYLVNAHIAAEALENTRKSRKLLVKKKELTSLETKIKAKKLTLIPLSMYTKGRLVKVEVALSKSKKEFQKKDSIKKRDIDRDVEIELKGTN